MGNGLNPFKENPLSFAYEPLINPPFSVESENENLRVFGFKELKKATNNFRQDKVVIGEDSSVRTFYKGYINETIAVYVVECPKDSSQDLQAWMEKVKSQGEISHPNLVKLLGYSCEDNKSRFLVFEYLHKGSLDRHILGKEEEEVLPWEIRVNIAIGIAQALTFIHATKNISIHEEIRMHNIMLDKQYNAKLLYLESNRQPLEVDQDHCRRIRGSEYLAPEFAMTGHIGMKGDVYIFGLILLELLTGHKAFDTERDKDKWMLDLWTKSFLSGKDKIREIIDPRLGNDYPVKAARRMGEVIKCCIPQDLTIRPLMQVVLEALNIIAKMKN